MLKSTWDQLNSKTVNYSTIVIRTISWTQGKGNSMVFDFAILKTGQENSHFFDFLFLKTGPGNRIAFDFRFWCCLCRAASWQNKQNDLCAQWRLWSAWASAQSDQSSLSAWRNIGSSGTHWAHCEDSQTLRLGGCPGWSESSLATQTILLVLSWGGSFIIYALM